MRTLVWMISIIVLVVFIAIFAMLNHAAVVLHLFFAQVEMTLVAALAWAFSVGMLATVLLLGYPLIQLRIRCRRLIIKNNQLEKRLCSIDGE